MRPAYLNIPTCCILGLAMAGCKPPDAPAVSSIPTHAATAATTKPATLRDVKEPCVFRVDGKAFPFASPLVVVDREASPLQLLVYSGDQESDAPAFYFEMPLEEPLVNGQAVSWEQQLPPREREDSLVGLQLPGRTLQPLELQMNVQPVEGRQVRVQVSGVFLVFAGDSTTATARAKVQGEFAAILDASAGGRHE